MKTIKELETEIKDFNAIHQGFDYTTREEVESYKQALKDVLGLIEESATHTIDLTQIELIDKEELKKRING